MKYFLAEITQQISRGTNSDDYDYLTTQFVIPVTSETQADQLASQILNCKIVRELPEGELNVNTER